MTDASVTAERTSMTRQETTLIWLVLAAAFVAILNETTMSIALKHLMDDLHIDAVQGQWLTTAFMLTMAVVIPTTGFLLQRFTTRGVFLTAVSLFAAGTAVATFAPNFEVLLGARVVQASGTAIMMPLLMTTVMTLVPPASRGRFMGRISIVMSLAPAIGPSMAGLVLQHLSWHWIFGLVLPIALVALVAGAVWMPRGGETNRAPLDLLSVPLSALAFGGIVFGLSQIGGAERGGSAATGATTALVVAFAIGVVSLALFVWRQLVLARRDDALLDLRVFASRNFTLSIIQMGVLSAAFFGAITVPPLYLQNVVGLEAMEAALVLLPGALAMGLLGPFIGRIYDARGPRVLLVPGAVIAVGMLWFYTTVNEHTSVIVLAVAQTLLSIGLALSFTPLFTASLASLQPKFYSHGSAVLGTVQQVAGAAGVALLITVMTAVTVQAKADGLSGVAAGAAGTHMAFLLAAIVAMPTLVLAFLIRKPDEPHVEPAAEAAEAPAAH